MPAKLVGLKGLERHLNTVLKQAPRAVGAIGVNTFKESFRLQRFNDTNSQRWEATKSGKRSAILIGKQSGRLRNSIRVTQANTNVVHIGSDADYAEIHNKGGTVHPRVTDKMRKYAWARYYEISGKGVRTGKKGNVYQSMSVGKEANKWKGLALTRKTKLDITIPKRQFMGKSTVLNKRLEEWFTRKLNYRF